MKRAVYDKQFKMADVKLVGTSSSTVNEVAKELGISTSSLRRWVNKYDEYGESAFPGHGNALFNSTYEIKKLQKQNDELRKMKRLPKSLRRSLRNIMDDAEHAVSSRYCCKEISM